MTKKMWIVATWPIGEPDLVDQVGWYTTKAEAQDCAAHYASTLDKDCDDEVVVFEAEIVETVQ